MLSPLLLPHVALAPAWEEVQQRRLQGREALEEQDQQGIQEFASRLKARQARFFEISQAQFEARERLQAAGRALEDRLEAQRSVAERVAALQDDLALAQTQYQISRALASPANDTLLVPDEPQKIKEEVMRLKEAGLSSEIQTDSTSGVRRARVLWPAGVAPRNPRVHYAASRDALKVLCDRLEAQVSQAETDAEVRRLQSTEEREQEIRARVALQLAGLRSRAEDFVLKLDQEASLDRILLAEELPTRRAVGASPAAIKTSREWRAKVPQPLASLPQRKQGENRLKEAELRALVEDAAQQRNIVVSYSPQPGVPDRTAEFANWIKVSL